MSLSIPTPRTSFYKGKWPAEGTQTWLMQSCGNRTARLMLSNRQDCLFCLKATFKNGMLATLDRMTHNTFRADEGGATFVVPFDTMDISTNLHKTNLAQIYDAGTPVDKYLNMRAPRGFRLSKHYHIPVELQLECTAEFTDGRMKRWNSTKFKGLNITWTKKHDKYYDGKDMLIQAVEEVRTAEKAAALATSAFRSAKRQK